LEDLEFMGLSAAALFPGLDGVCRMMRNQITYKRLLPQPGRAEGIYEAETTGAGDEVPVTKRIGD
jgi:hypothetical protein